MSTRLKNFFFKLFTGSQEKIVYRCAWSKKTNSIDETLHFDNSRLQLKIAVGLPANQRHLNDVYTLSAFIHIMQSLDI